MVSSSQSRNLIGEFGSILLINKRTLKFGTHQQGSSLKISKKKEKYHGPKK